MRLPILFAAGVSLSGLAAALPTAAETPATSATQASAGLIVDVSAQRKKRPRGYGAYGQSRRQIACTPAGCHLIPPGCWIRAGYNPFTWDPTGFDEVVCPYRR